MRIGLWRQRVTEGQNSSLRWARAGFIAVLASVALLIIASWSQVFAVRRLERSATEMLETTKEIQRQFTMAQQASLVQATLTRRAAEAARLAAQDARQAAQQSEQNQDLMLRSLAVTRGVARDVKATKRQVARIDRRQRAIGRRALRNSKRLGYIEGRERREGPHERRQDSELRRLERRRHKR